MAALVEYYDILLLGNTGMGKSATANKLIETVPSPKVEESEKSDIPSTEESEKSDIPSTEEEAKQPLKVFSHVVEKFGGYIETYFCDSVLELFYFPVGNGTDSCTKMCDLKCNVLSGVRVLDTPGFADSNNTKEFGVYEGNLKSVRSILRCQQEHNLKFRRVLYFIPTRGPLSRANGILQEEIKVMYGYFKRTFFNRMVIIATRDKDDDTESSLDQNLPKLKTPLWMHIKL